MVEGQPNYSSQVAVLERPSFNVRPPEASLNTQMATFRGIWACRGMIPSLHKPGNMEHFRQILETSGNDCKQMTEALMKEMGAVVTRDAKAVAREIDNPKNFAVRTILDLTGIPPKAQRNLARWGKQEKEEIEELARQEEIQRQQREAEEEARRQAEQAKEEARISAEIAAAQAKARQDEKTAALEKHKQIHEAWRNHKAKDGTPLAGPGVHSGSKVRSRKAKRNHINLPG